MFARSSVVALLLAASSMFANAVPCNRQYTVQPGDICDSISAAQNVSTFQLAVINPSINSACSNLVPGSTLCLGYQNEDCTTTYVVQPNDDCEKVSAAHMINTTILWANNRQLDSTCDNMYVGEVLCVASSAIAYPSSNGQPANTAIPSTASPADDDNLPWCD